MLALLVGTDYLFSLRARPENLFPGKPRTKYLFSTANKFFKKQKKKKKRWGVGVGWGGGWGGGGLVRGILVEGTGHGFLCLA